MEKVIDFFDIEIEGNDHFIGGQFTSRYTDVTIPQVFKILEYYFKSKDFETTDVSISYQYGFPEHKEERIDEFTYDNCS